MAKKSKSRFTNLVQFVQEPEEDFDYEQESNNEIRTNVLDTKYDDSYDEYDEYDAYVPDDVESQQEKEVTEDSAEETVIEIELSAEEVVEKVTVETIEKEKIEQNVDVQTINDYESDFDTLYQRNKEENEMKREVPDFIKNDKVEVQKTMPQPQVGAQRYQQTQFVEQPNMKESIILGNTTIKGDIITDAGIQIYGAVIGNIESGGCVQLVGKVEGDIAGKSVIITNTSLNGNIQAEDDVSIKAGCVVTGDVAGTKVVLNGTIRGNIDASGQVDFEAGSVVDGNVSAKSFNIKPGARINGSISTK